MNKHFMLGLMLALSPMIATAQESTADVEAMAEDVSPNQEAMAARLGNLSPSDQMQVMMFFQGMQQDRQTMLLLQLALQSAIHTIKNTEGVWLNSILTGGALTGLATLLTYQGGAAWSPKTRYLATAFTGLGGAISTLLLMNKYNKQLGLQMGYLNKLKQTLEVNQQQIAQYLMREEEGETTETEPIADKD